MFLPSFGGHFFEHLTCLRPINAVFSFRRCMSRMTEDSSHFSTVWSGNKVRQKQPRSYCLTGIRCHSASLNDDAISSSDSLTSPYLSVRICCPVHVSDLLSESLMCFGAGSTTVNAEDNQESAKEIWITSIFNGSQDVRQCILCAADSIGLKEIPSYEIEIHDNADWIKKTKESFQPVKIKDGLWILPEWRNPLDLQAINIILNPGLAFGTGEHPTTKLCLLLLHETIKGGESFLDYGTGSGVLAIAALKFGARLSVGFDIEPQAITSARYNAALNNIGPNELLLTLVPGQDGPHFETQLQSKESAALDSYNPEIIAGTNKYDVVIANILLYPLLVLADKIISYANPGAIIGISGIISEQVPSVTKRYSQFLNNIRVSTMDDWACISGSRKTEAGH